MPRKIFICYRRDDANAAGRVGDALSAAFGHDEVFIDTEDLPLGRQFDSQLVQTLRQTDVFIMVVGPQWLEALATRDKNGQIDYVLEEIKVALQLHLTVIPVLVDGAVFPDESLLPDEIRHVARWQSHEVGSNRFRRDANELIEAITLIRGRRPQRAGVSQFILPIAGMCIVVVALLWWMLSGRESPVDPGDNEASAEAGGLVNEIESGDSTGVSDGVAAIEETANDADSLVSADADISTAAADSPDAATGIASGSADPPPEDENVLAAADEVTSSQSPETSISAGAVPAPSGVADQAGSASPVEQWSPVASVFPNQEFSLCGYDSFTAQPVRDGAELLVHSDDREIPGQTFPRLKWTVKIDQPVELFEGCSALFSYENLAGGERIHVRVKGE